MTALEELFDGRSFQRWQFDPTVHRIKGQSKHAGSLRDNTISGTLGEKIRKELARVRETFREGGMSRENPSGEFTL